MKRWKLLLEIVLLLGMMATAVYFGSSYSVVVDGVKEIEALWEIEDTRQESEQPLVTVLMNDGVPLAYDREENTFYCSLGLEQGGEWPQLHLTAPDAQGISICFSDDYTYDWCSDAIAEGYAYELMAYSDTEYSYFNLVFTGLPIVTITHEGSMTTEDIPVSFAMNCYGGEAFASPGRAHLRGDGSLMWSQKAGYKVEFTRRTDGTGKIAQNVPGFDRTDEVLLLPMPFDETLMLDRLSWEMYGLITPDTEPFSARKTQYAEVFVNEEYAGVYLMMLPFAVEKELAKAGSRALETDSLYRTGVPSMTKDRLSYTGGRPGEATYELFYTPDPHRAFEPLEAYIELSREADDERFRQKAQANVDILSAVRYLMFLQAAGLSDNTGNNMYLWAHIQNGNLKYRFEPWDMDRSWGIDALPDYEGWFAVPVIDRIVNLDVGGAKDMLKQVWAQMREKAFTYETVEQLVSGYMHELNDSGAFMRNAERWELEVSQADASQILDYCSVRFGMLDEAVERIVSAQGLLGFLSADVRRGDHGVTSMIDPNNW